MTVTEVPLPQPSLVWEGQASCEALGEYTARYGRWRVVLAHHYPSSPGPYGRRMDYTRVLSHLVIERSTTRDVLGFPIWQQAEALPAAVLQELLKSASPIRAWEAEVSEALACAEGSAP